MASTFSPAYQVRSICYASDPPKAVASFTDSNVKFRCVSSWKSSSSCVKLQAGAKGLYRNPAVALQPLRKRSGVVKAATIEEIDKQKSMIEKDAKERMEKTIESMKSGFSSLRTGRANPAMLDKIEVEYYGTPVSLKSIAQVSTPDSSSFLVQPYDKSSLKSIEKAIVTSDLGMNPNNDGDVIRLTLPQLTSERRKELSKLVAKQAEETKVAVRNIRRDAIKAYDKLEKEKKLSEDVVKDLTADLQKVTDEYVKKIDLIYKQKEKELSKLVAKQAEETKVAARNIRRDAIKAYDKLEKEKKLSEDVVKDLTADLQKVTDEYVKKIDLIYKQREGVDDSLTTVSEIVRSYLL